MKEIRELGVLEERVMGSMWTLQRATVADVCSHLSQSRAYTTIMTTLDRLHRKGLLQRVRNGRCFVYEPALQRTEMEQVRGRQLVDAALDVSDDRRPILSCFVGAVTERDRAALDELEELIKQKRRKMRRG